MRVFSVTSEEDRAGPSERELELEEEFQAVKAQRQRNREEILEEQERYAAERSGTLTPQQGNRSMSFNRDRFPDGSAVDFDLPPHLLESAARTLRVYTRNGRRSIQYVWGRRLFHEPWRYAYFHGVDGKPLKDIVNGTS